MPFQAAWPRQAARSTSGTGGTFRAVGQLRRSSARSDWRGHRGRRPARCQERARGQLVGSPQQKTAPAGARWELAVPPQRQSLPRNHHQGLRRQSCRGGSVHRRAESAASRRWRVQGRAPPSQETEGLPGLTAASPRMPAAGLAVAWPAGERSGQGSQCTAAWLASVGAAGWPAGGRGGAARLRGGGRALRPKAGSSVGDAGRRVAWQVPYSALRFCARGGGESRVAPSPHS